MNLNEGRGGGGCCNFLFVGKRIELWNLISSIEAARPHSPLSDRLKLARGIESGGELADCRLFMGN